ncbi:hypothetical protein GGI35DRAFT_386693 [Trichoderma velutinum]
MIVVFCKSPIFLFILPCSCPRRSTKVGIARLDHRNQLTGTHAAGFGEAVGLRMVPWGFRGWGAPDNLSDCRTG